MGDIGINTTTSIIEHLKEEVEEKKIKEPSECKQLLIDEIKRQMDVGDTAYEFENRKSVVLVIGVNGVGKTTSVGKLAGKLKDQGKKVIVAAADTYRAAAGEQLTEWAHRAGVDLIGGQAGADPAAIVYDAVAAAKARNADVLLCDTAGRLHNKKNLMEELERFTVCWRENTRMLIWRHWLFWMVQLTECTGTGETVQRGGKRHRYHSYKTGRNCKRRHCRSNRVRAGYSGKIYRCGRIHR